MSGSITPGSVSGVVDDTFRLHYISMLYINESFKDLFSGKFGIQSAYVKNINNLNNLAADINAKLTRYVFSIDMKAKAVIGGEINALQKKYISQLAVIRATEANGVDPTPNGGKVKV